MLQLSANDIDLEPTLTYSVISGNHDNAFVINQRTGLLSVANRLDFERIASYQLKIQVFPSGYLLVYLLNLFIYLFTVYLSQLTLSVLRWQEWHPACRMSRSSNLQILFWRSGLMSNLSGK